jgi:gamma-aminobutyric acid receptor subunit alpha
MLVYRITILYRSLDAYTSGQLIYEWQEGSSVNFVPGMALSQFDLMGSPYRNLTFVRREGEFSVLQVSFNLQRHTGYFLIQVSELWRSL